MANSLTLRNIAFGSVGLVTLALMIATLVERLAGTEAASSFIYHSPWMIALWVIAGACSIAWLMARRRGMSVAVAGLHLSLLLILVGAGISYLFGKQGKVTLTSGKPPVSAFIAEYGLKESLPFSLALDHSEIEYYPGTSAPMDYASVVKVGEKSGATSLRRLSMNNILEVQGYRFYQTSLGQDSSTLSVSYDPWGIGVTYAGYITLLVSMLGFFVSRKTRFRRLLRHSAPILLLLLISGCAMADNADVPPTIPKALAARLGKVNVYWGDRVMPLQTMARDFCLKVNGSTSYRGLTAEQVVAGWLFYYDAWKNEPFIKVEGAEAKRLLGADGSDYASIKDFYSPRGYKLEHAVADDLADRKLRDTDLRVGMVTMACTGSAFKVFPMAAKSGGAVEWLSFADRPAADMNEEDYVLITTILDRISREVAGRQWKNADDEITRLREFQASAAGGALPSEGRLEAELVYNRFGSPLWPGLVALLSGIAGFVVAAKWHRLRYILTALLFIWVSLIMGVRWYIGGHVPLSNGYETMLLMGWLSMLAALIFYPTKRLAVAANAALAVGGLSLLVAMMGRGGATVSHLMPVLASPLLSIHVLLVMASYALLAIIAIISGKVLCTKEPQKERSLARVSTLLLYPAIFMLAGGIFVGAVWANQSWGRYWGWDPKETWALITLLVYAFPLHVSSFPRFRRPRTLSLYLLLAFLTVLMTYFGVNHLLTGLHSYA